MMLPSLVGESGLGNVMGGNLSWSSSPEAVTRTGRSTAVTISATNSGSDIQVRDRLGQIAGGVFGGVMGGVGLGAGLGIGIGVGGGVLGSIAFMTLVPLGALAGTYLLSRLIYSIVSKMRKKQTGELAEKIRQLIESGMPEDQVESK